MEYLLKIYHKNPGANEAFEWRTKSLNDSWRFRKETQHSFPCSSSPVLVGPVRLHRAQTLPHRPPLYSLHTGEIMNGYNGYVQAEKQQKRQPQSVFHPEFSVQSGRKAGTATTIRVSPGILRTV